MEFRTRTMEFRARKHLPLTGILHTPAPYLVLVNRQDAIDAPAPTRREGRQEGRRKRKRDGILFAPLAIWAKTLVIVATPA
jgi:predicted RNA polymerase sigma factor